MSWCPVLSCFLFPGGARGAEAVALPGHASLPPSHVATLECPGLLCQFLEPWLAWLGLSTAHPSPRGPGHAQRGARGAVCPRHCHAPLWASILPSAEEAIKQWFWGSSSSPQGTLGDFWGHLWFSHWRSAWHRVWVAPGMLFDTPQCPGSPRKRTKRPGCQQCREGEGSSRFGNWRTPPYRRAACL